MAKYSNHYECPCGHTWADEWDCGCDDRCSMCNTSCSPSFSYDLDNPEEVNEMRHNHDYETLEEHTARMKRIRDEVTADIKAGRYKNGQIHPHIRGNYAGSLTGRVQDHTDYMKWFTRSLFHELHMEHFNEMIRERSKVDMQMINFDSLFSPSRRPLPSIIMDECHYIEPKDMWLRPEPREKDWDRKMFKSGPPTTPSEATRIKRREERKRKKGSK